MEALNKRKYKTIPFKPHVFNINSKEYSSSAEQIKFTHTKTLKGININASSPLFERDNYKIMVNGNRLTIIVLENKDIDKPINIHNLSINALGDGYEQMKCFDYSLPHDNYAIGQVKWNEDRNEIRIEVIDYPRNIKYPTPKTPKLKSLFENSTKTKLI